MADEQIEETESSLLLLDLETHAELLGRRRGAIAQCSSPYAPRYETESNRQQERRSAISFSRDYNRHYQILFTSGEDLVNRFDKMLTIVEKNLLAELQTEEGQQRHTGSFLTLRKRRYKNRRNCVLSGDNRDHGIFCEVHQKQTMKILSRIGRWDFNTFALDSVTAGRPLPTLLMHLFHHYGLIRVFQLDVVKVWKCFILIEDGYHSKNPYHNAVHATDVTQAMHCFLQESLILKHLSPMELMTSILAAVTHDLDHPGVNQPFLIATSNHLAALYKNSSVLENHHWRSAVCCIMQSGMLDHFKRNQWDEITFQIRSLILATDITRQNEFLTRLKLYVDEELLDMKDSHYRHFILQIALKCADICNPCRTWEISSRWSQQVCEEFFRQGDVERQLNLPVTALCDRYNTSIAKIQTSFFQFVVAPLFEAWDHLLQTPLSSSLVRNLRANQEKWENMVSEESKESEAQPSCDSSSLNLVVSSIDSNMAVSDIWIRDCSNRRHSVPVNFPRNSFLQLQSDDISQSFYVPTNWASSLSTVAQYDLLKRNSCIPSVSNESLPLNARTVVRQTTFPPLQVLQQQSSRTDTEIVENVTSKCTNNGCGSSSESINDEELNNVKENHVVLSANTRDINAEEQTTSDCNNRSSHLHQKIKPLVRLKSEGDLSRCSISNNGKLIVAPSKVQLSTNKKEEEKENAIPEFRVGWQLMRGSYRKVRPQGVNFICPRLSSRRSSAPVGMLKEELTSCLAKFCDAHKSEILENKPLKRRDSAPVDLCRDRGNNDNRRGSLPTDLLVDSLLNSQVAVDQQSTLFSATVGSNRLANCSVRRQSMPSDFNIGSHRRGNHMIKVSELFSTPLRSWSSGGVDISLNHLNLAQQCCSLKNEQRLNFFRQAQSFDATLIDENCSQKNVHNWMKDLSSRKALYPLHRRSSVPTEAWLFSTSPTFSAGEEQSCDLIVDLN